MSEPKNFETKEDFTKYYNEHREEIDKLSVKDLNEMFKIKSCKIIKMKNKIIIRSETSKDNKENKEKEEKPKPKDKPKPKQKKQSDQKDILKMIDSLINHYEKQLIQLKEMKNKIVSENLFDSEHDN